MSLCSGSQSRLSPQPLESQHFPSAAAASVGMNLSKSHSVPLLHGIKLHPAPSPQSRSHGPLDLYQLCNKHQSLLPFFQSSVCHSFLSVCHSFLSCPMETPLLNVRQKSHAPPFPLDRVGNVMVWQQLPTHTHTRMHTHTHMHAHTHTYTHARIQAHTHAHVHTHKSTFKFSLPFSSLYYFCIFYVQNMVEW